MIFKRLIILVYVCMHECMYAHWLHVEAVGNQENILDTQELETEVV